MTALLFLGYTAIYNEKIISKFLKGLKFNNNPGTIKVETTSFHRNVVFVWDTCGISHYCSRLMSVIDNEAKIALHSGFTLERRRHFGYFYRASSIGCLSPASVSKISLKN